MEEIDEAANVEHKVSGPNQVKTELLVMEKTAEERGNLAFDEIWNESFKIFKRSAWPFLCIQLTLLLPSVILTICFAFLLWSYVPPEYSDLVIGFPNQLQCPLSISWDTLLQLLPFLGMFIMGFVGLLPIYALSVSANMYAVVLLFTDKAVSLASVLEGGIPRLWMRLSTTHLCWPILLVLPTILLIGGTHVLVVWVGCVERSDWLLFWIAVFVKNAMEMSSFMFAAMIFMLVSAVCVFEDTCGWDSLRRAWQLVQGKVLVAYRLQGKACIVEFTLFLMLVSTGALFNLWLSIGLPLSILLLVGGVAVVTFHFQMACISAGVAYVSFKAYQDTSAESSVLHAASEGVYQPIPDGVNPADDDSVNESHPDNLV